MKILFWLSIFMIIYHIGGYVLILWIINLFKQKEKKDVNKNNEKDQPSITVLCPAYNEVTVIEDKIRSFLDLDYPSDKIAMIVISDNSDDGTNEIVKKYAKNYSRIKLVIQKPRKGKPSGHNLVEPTIKSEYVVSTDANSIFAKDSIAQLVKTARSEKNIGMVIGQLKLFSNGKDSGEGLYWKYENFLKTSESKTYSIICANGSLFLLKRELFTQIHPSSVDDFERTLIVLENKFTAKFNKNAIVIEDVSQRPIEEMNRKIRIISREWFALFRHIRLLNPITNCRNSLFLISHKLIRWLLPVWSGSVLLSNIFLINQNIYYKIFLALQVGLILFGLIEVLLEKNNKSIKILKLPAYILVMNYASAAALVKVLKGEQQTTWSTLRSKEET